MSSHFIEPEPELRLILMPEPGEKLRSPEFQSELSAFAHALREHGIEVSQRCFTQDAVGGGSWGTGEFVLVTTLGPVLIIQLRKLLEAILVRGRQVAITNGKVTVKGSAKDIQTLLTPEQIEKLIEPKPQPKPQKKLTHG